MAVCCSNDFGEFTRALLLGLEQSHILDSDHRLIGEGLDQLDLLFGERPYLGARQHDYADRSSFAHERNAKHGTILTDGPLLD